MNKRSEDLYRTKGVLSIDGWDERFVFQVCLAVVEHCILHSGGFKARNPVWGNYWTCRHEDQG